LYTSGGVEKSAGKPVKAQGAALLKSRRSEGRIVKTVEGTTAVIYPDSDDDEQMPIDNATAVNGEETLVVKGTMPLSSKC
jgi:hypothetical protein